MNAQPITCPRRPLHLLHRPLAAALALLLAPAAFAQNLPDGFTLKSGSVDLPSTVGQTMTIGQHSKGAIIEWNGFNIANGYHVDFRQPGVDSVTLNRVTGAGMSQIDGMLSANGRVFVVNTAGVLFGSNAQVNVGGLVASTLSISDTDFNAGVDSGHFVFAGDGNATISNLGSLATAAGGTIALLSGGSISNSGTINAPGGTVALGWGHAITLDIGGDGLTNLILAPSSNHGGVATIVNSGTLQADGGQVVLRADLGNISGVVNQSGIVRARSLQNRAGQIVLDAGANELDITGSNDAGAGDAGVAGGTITASANRLLVNTGAAFNAGGGSGGANGNLTINSVSDIVIASAGQITTDLGNNLHASASHLLDSALGGALGNGTNVTLNGLGQPSGSGYLDGAVSMLDGITFPYTPQQITDAPAQIVKNASVDAQLTINANRDIVMGTGTAITASSGALGIDLNADSHGQPAPIPNNPTLFQSGGHIELDGANIASNGGAIRFYGQSDAVNGRATGSVNYVIGGSAVFTVVAPDGINLNDSTLDACAYAGTSCGGSGSISLRGQGIDNPSITPKIGGMGILALGSTLRSGSGAIALDGIGGIVASGVWFGNDINSDTGQLISAGVIQSASGTIGITGRAGDEATAGSAAYYDTASGVLLGSVPISTGGSIDVQGTGATRSTTGATQSIASSDGVDVLGASLNAGAGQSITISGQAGSAGANVDPATGLSTPTPVYGIKASSSGDLVRATPGGLVSHGGTLAMHGLAGSDLYVDTTLDASATAGIGGPITLDGNNIQLTGGSHLDADGNGGGALSVNAAGVLAMDAGSTASANALANGNGGSVRLFGSQGLYAYGNASAHGGSASGNGGSVDTSSAGGISLNGFRVDAGASNGNAGQWIIDPYDVVITNGSASGSLTSNPFVPLANSTIQDGDINAALNGGTSVTITTGTSGSTTNGSITINSGVDILRTVGTVPLTFRLDANTNISGNNPFTIQSTAGALNLVFDSNASSVNTNNGNISFNGANLLTNGGSIAMFGQNDPVNGFAQSFITGISLYQSTLDTRVAGNDANPGGAISLRGSAGYYGGGTGVSLGQTDLHSSTGNIDIFGVGIGGGSGVSLTASTLGSASQITTTSGSLAITGIGSTSGFQFGSLDGLSTVNYTLQSTTGTIDLRGYGAVNGSNGNTAVSNDGLVLDSLTTVSSVSGDVYLSGMSAGSGAGVSLVGTQGAPPTIDSGSGNIVVRAHNDGSTDALVVDGTLASIGTIDLRPGGVDANGALTENPNDAITLGGSTGFALSAPEIGNIAAHDLVLGSDMQAGTTTVSAPITYAHNLTLDSGAGGGIAVNGALDVGTNTLALISAGDITQTAPVTAASLLAQSGAGLVNLGNAGNNVSSATLAGSASGDFTFVNAGTVGIGNVTSTGFGAAGNTPTVLAGAGVSGNNVLVRALTGNMILNANVSGNTVNLVADGPTGLFLNNTGASIAAGSYWHVWASTWVGENRGGLAGAGTLPNLYGCAFSATCTVTPLNTANQFIYIAQPVATIAIGNLSREYGLPNPALTYVTSGLILGDQAVNAISGSPATAATQASNVGSYAINGNFTSPAGYVLKIANGALAVTPATLTYVANPQQRLVGTPNGTFSGSVNGFRNGDTLTSATTGTLGFQSPADINSPIGVYGIFGNGLGATNYVFVQANGNATALTIMPPLGTYTLDVIRDTPVTYVYDRNFGMVGLCPATDLTSSSRDQDGDTLAREWSRVRSRPNLANCVSTKQKNSCGDF
jgi:filamentous hemagglutinin family protein